MDEDKPPTSIPQQPQQPVTPKPDDSPWTSPPPPTPPVQPTTPPSSTSPNWWEKLEQQPEETPRSQPVPEPQPTAQTPPPEEPLPPQDLAQIPTTADKPPPITTPPPPPSLQTETPSGGSSNFLGTLVKLLLGLAFIIILVVLGIKVLSIIKGKSAPKTVTLSYWGLWEDKNTLGTVFAEFEKAHPDIKIDYQKRDIKQYRETLKARIAGGQGPDIFRFHNSWLPMLKEDLLPLPKEVMGDNPQKDFYPVVTRDVAVGGAYYGIPLEIDTLVLFINSDLFKNANLSPPKTWNELRSIAPQLTTKDTGGKIKTAGVALGTFDNINHASDILSLMFAQNGVDPKLIKQKQENSQDTLSFYTSFAKGDSKVWDETLDSSLLAFTKGSLAMFFGYSWDALTIRAINPDLKFEIAAVPQLDENKKITLASYWVEGVSKKSKNQKAAFALLSFLASKETSQKLYSEQAKSRIFGEPYARTDLADFLKDNSYLQTVVLQAKDAISTPFSSDTYDNGLNSELNKYLGDAVRSVLGNTSPETALETLSQGINAVFTKYGVR